MKNNNDPIKAKDQDPPGDENPYAICKRKADAFGKGYGNGDPEKEALAHNIYFSGFWDAIEYFGLSSPNSINPQPGGNNLNK